MHRPSKSFVVIMSLTMIIAPAAGLLALPIEDAQIQVPNVHTREPLRTGPAEARALSTIVHTSLTDFTSGAHDLTMATNSSGGALQLASLYTFNGPIPGDGGIFSITVGKDGAIFAGGMNSGRMVRVNSTTNEVRDVNGGNQVVTGQALISALATGNDGTIWGGTGGGHVFRMDPDTEAVTVLNSGNPVDASMVIGFIVLPNGTIWSSTLSPVVFEIDPSTDTITTHGTFSGSIPGNLRSVATDLDDNVWFGGTDGIDSHLSKVNTATKAVDWHGKAVIGDGVVKTLVLAQNGSMWGATEGGTTLFRVDVGNPPKIVPFGNPTGGLSTDTTAMAIGPDGNVWAGTRFTAHIYQFDQRSGLAVDHGRVFPNAQSMRGLAMAPDGSIWGGTQAASGDGEIFRFHPYTGFTRPMANETWIRALTTTADGLIWGATQDDLDIARGSLMFSYDPENDHLIVLNGSNPIIPGDIITALSTGADGRIWGGTETGRLVFALNTTTMGMTFANGSNPISADAITGLATGDDGTIWGSTMAGHVFRTDPSDGTTTVLNGGDELLPGLGMISELIVVANGTVWGCSQTTGGLFSIDPATDAVTDWGQAVAGQTIAYSMTEGANGLIYGATWEIGQAGHLFSLTPSNGSYVDLGVPGTGNPVISSLQADGKGGIWGGMMSPNGLLSIDEATGQVHVGPGPVPNHQATRALILAPDGDLWGMTQGNRFGGDEVHIFRYILRASYTSPALDLGETSHVSYLNWTETSGLNNATVAFSMRSAPTQAQLQGASWSTPDRTSGRSPQVPDGRWVQYRAHLMKLDTGLAASPVIEEVVVAYKQIPMMTVEKTVDKAVAKRGEEISYTIHYNNTGSVDAINVQVNDTLDPDLIIIISSDEANRTGSSWSYPVVPAGTDNSLTVTVRVDASARAGKVVNNTATLTFSDMDGWIVGVLTSNQVSTLIEEVDLPDVTVSKSVDKGLVLPGEQVVYTITVNNTGPGVADNVTIEDNVDSNLAILQVEGAVSGSSPTWNIGPIIPGHETSLVVTVQVDDTIDTDLTIYNNATVNWTSVLGDPLQGKVTNTVSTYVKGGPAPILEVRKEVNVTKAGPGGHIQYTIYFNNTGSSNASTVTVTDALSTYLTYVSSNAEEARSGDVWAFTNISPGTGGVLVINATVDTNVPNNTLIPNTATVSYENGTGALVDTLSTNAVSTTVTVTVGPVLTLEKTVDKKVIPTGSALTYTIFYNNTGNGAAAWVELTELLPSTHVIFENTSKPYDEPFVWNLTDVGPGPHELVIKVLVKADVPKDTVIRNQVKANYSDMGGKQMGQLVASVTSLCTGGGTGDKVNPTVAGHLPTRGDILVPVTTEIEVHFSEPMNRTSAERAFSIEPAVQGNFTWDGNTMFFKPSSKLQYDTTYTVRIGTGAKDLAGNPLLSPYPFNFKTERKEHIPDDQGNIGCYMATALFVGVLLGLFFFFIAYRRKFKEIELVKETAEEEKEKKGSKEKKVKARGHEEGSEDGPDEDEGPGDDTEEEEIDELEEEAGAGPEESLAEEEDAEEEDGEDEEEDQGEGAAGEEDEEDGEGAGVEKEPEGTTEADTRKEDKGPKEGGSLDDIMKRLRG